MTDRKIFGEVVKDILNNLYDIAALETHPLLDSIFNVPDEYRLNRAEYARQMVLDTIEQIKPVGREENSSSPEWRPYMILHERYVDGVNLQELAEQLSISPRQMRRDQHKAIEALTELLWVRQNPVIEPKIQSAELEEADLEFAVHKEVIDLLETTRGVCELLSKKCQEKGASFVFPTEERTWPVVTDRIVLRQILINLFNAVFQFAAKAPIRITVVDEIDQLALVIEAAFGYQQDADALIDEHDRDSVMYWCNYIQAAIDLSTEETADLALMRITLRLPRSGEKIILVVDDQEASINMFRRYLSQSQYLIVGANNAELALNLAEQLQPVLITLDVMMPQHDGWELLQLLRINDRTRRIPVVVCSAWADRDLSIELGAAGFIKKPVTQKMLLDAVQRLSSSALAGS